MRAVSPDHDQLTTPGRRSAPRTRTVLDVICETLRGMESPYYVVLSRFTGQVAHGSLEGLKFVKSWCTRLRCAFVYRMSHSLTVIGDPRVEGFKHFVLYTGCESLDDTANLLDLARFSATNHTVSTRDTLLCEFIQAMQQKVTEPPYFWNTSQIGSPLAANPFRFVFVFSCVF